MMTSDKQQHNNGSLAKPFTPALSAAFNRNSKSPLTPKLASPGGYRTPKRLVPSHERPVSTPEPDSAYLTANVTPRSGSRNTRRDGVLSPNNAPSSVPSSPHVSYSHAGVAQVSNPRLLRTERSPVRAHGRLEPTRSDRAKTLTTEHAQVSRPKSVCDAPSGSRMFFHAYDAARSPSSSEVDFRPKPPSKASTPATFVYANGQQEQQSANDEAVVTAPTLKRRSIGSARSVLGPKPPALPSPRLRPAKLAESSTARTTDGAASVVGSLRDDVSEVSSHVQGSFSGGNFPVRPALPGMRHFKSSSMDSSASSPHLKEGLRPSPIIVSPAESSIDGHPGVSESIPGLRPRIFSNGSLASIDTQASATQSPVKSESSGPASNGVVNARTERKILDLEISNSSLLAINRTLEREMRKQNAELRRYRRLSRSGRLSVAPSARSFSGTSLSITAEADEEASDLSSTRSPEELSDFSDEEESTLDESTVDSEAIAEHDARHRATDEKRFFIDLAKHQELLADSQKINQSLKRCLGWTEDLIREGKKALEYSVHVNDVQLGGRVLPPEELLDAEEGGKALLSPVGDTADPLLSAVDVDVDVDFDLSLDLDMSASESIDLPLQS